MPVFCPLLQSITLTITTPVASCLLQHVCGGTALSKTKRNGWPERYAQCTDTSLRSVLAHVDSKALKLTVLVKQSGLSRTVDPTTQGHSIFSAALLC